MFRKRYARAIFNAINTDAQIGNGACQQRDASVNAGDALRCFRVYMLPGVVHADEALILPTGGGVAHAGAGEQIAQAFKHWPNLRARKASAVAFQHFARRRAARILIFCVAAAAVCFDVFLFGCFVGLSAFGKFAEVAIEYADK